MKSAGTVRGVCAAQNIPARHSMLRATARSDVGGRRELGATISCRSIRYGTFASGWRHHGQMCFSRGVMAIGKLCAAVHTWCSGGVHLASSHGGGSDGQRHSTRVWFVAHAVVPGCGSPHHSDSQRLHSSRQGLVLITAASNGLRLAPALSQVVAQRLS